MLVAICIYFALTTSHFASLDNVQAIIVQASIILILAVGATYVIVMGSIDLSVEGVMAAAALTFALLVRNSVNHHSFGLLAVVAAVAVGLLMGAFSGAVHVLLRVPSFMVTLGTWFIGLGIATVLFGSQQPQIMDSSILGWSQPGLLGLPLLTYIAIAVTLLAVLLGKYTKFGRYNYGIGGDESIVKLSGVNISRHKILVFVLAGGCSALAGVLTTVQLGNASVDMSSGHLFITLSGVVVGGTLLSGGRGGVFHSVIGVFILTTLGDGLILAGVSPYWQGAIQGLIIVGAVLAASWPARAPLRVVK
ncbi:ABC transporter permease [Nocardioides terrisoli]|uniref:ABC transporter permease n=1 Tax=Nocardioides terrisoli TaxID=3388267 RepID=UPI00287BC16D|nr:ABC transporter permease [Nocardioides marmorisolisilvae]